MTERHDGRIDDLVAKLDADPEFNARMREAIGQGKREGVIPQDMFPGIKPQRRAKAIHQDRLA